MSYKTLPMRLLTSMQHVMSVSNSMLLPLASVLPPLLQAAAELEQEISGAVDGVVDKVLS